VIAAMSATSSVGCIAGPPKKHGGQHRDFAAGAQADTFNGVLSSLRTTLGLLQQGDVTPPAQVVALVGQRQKAFEALMERWKAFQTEATPR